MEVNVMNLGLKNFLMVTVIAIVGIVAFKVVFNKYPVKGITDVVNAV
jgi:hypothetical protein